MTALAQPLLWDVPATGAAAPLVLRPYQTRALADVAARRTPGARVLVVAPTGAGKTVLAAQAILDELAAGGRVLFLAHRRELLAQTYAKLLAMGLPEIRMGILMADGVIHHPVTGQRVCCQRPLAPVQVASIDTVRNRRLPPGITLIIIDEAHRGLAKSYVDVVEACPDAIVIGLTATPYRGDGRGLGKLFRELVVVATPRELIAAGFLAEPRAFSHPVKPDLSQVRLTAGDYDQEQLAKAVDKKELLGNIVEHWHRHLAGVRTVVFAASVAHSRHIVEAFLRDGVPAEHLDGETAPEVRAGILARLDRGETLVVSNAMVLVEGWDQPSVKGGVLACPTKSPTKYIQCAGRILRPWQGQTPVLLDHGGCVLEHGLPQDDREYSLEDHKKSKRTVSVKECPQCFGANVATAAVCAYCGTPLVKPADGAREGRDLREADGQLVEVRPGDVPLRKLPADVRALRHEIQAWATAVDKRYGLEPGATNRDLKRTFRKARAEMTPQELERVRAHLLERQQWLAGGASRTPTGTAPAPLFFETPEVAGW